MVKKEANTMTEKKKTKKPDTVTYKDKEYTVLQRTPDRVMLTDGLIHFWVKAEDVKA